MSEKSEKIQVTEEHAVRQRFMRLLEESLSTPSGHEIVSTLVDIGFFLIEKNKAYGDSALDPVRIMSKANPVEQILVRIDDKLSRLKSGDAAGEDVNQDLLGYFVLLSIARGRARRARAATAQVVEVNEGGT